LKRRASMAANARRGFEGEGVLLGAADLHLLGDVFGRLAQADDRVEGIEARVVVAPADRGVPHLGMAGHRHLLGLRHAPRRPAHGFDAAADEDVALAGDDRLGRLVDGFERRGAVAVDGDAGDLDREAGQQDRHAGDVAVVLAGLVAATGVDVLQQRRVDAGARHQALVDFGQQVVGADAGKPAAESADRAADAVDDHYFLHDGPLGWLAGRHGAARFWPGDATAE